MTPPQGHSSLCKLMLSLFLLTVSLYAVAQVRTVTGVVKDMAGNPLSGVSILVQKTNTGTTTDSGGRYSIRAAAGATLIFSSANGATAKVTVGDKAEYNVMLEPKVSALNSLAGSLTFSTEHSHLSR